MNKKFLKVSQKTAICILAFIGTYFLLVFILSAITIGGTSDKNGQINVFIMTNGIHTDIVVPAALPRKKLDYRNKIQ